MVGVDSHDPKFRSSETADGSPDSRASTFNQPDKRGQREMQSLISFQGKYYKSFAHISVGVPQMRDGEMSTPKKQVSCVYAFVLRKLALHLHFLLPFTLISNLNKSPAVFVYIYDGVGGGGWWLVVGDPEPEPLYSMWCIVCAIIKPIATPFFVCL